MLLIQLFGDFVVYLTYCFNLMVIDVDYQDLSLIHLIFNISRTLHSTSFATVTVEAISSSHPAEVKNLGTLLSSRMYSNAYCICFQES